VEEDKIKPDDTLQDIMTKMSEGNPGALTVLMETFDAKEPMEFMNFAMALDVHRIYRSDIWKGYKDHCGKDIEEFYTKVMESDEDLLEFLSG